MVVIPAVAPADVVTGKRDRFRVVHGHLRSTLEARYGNSLKRIHVLPPPRTGRAEIPRAQPLLFYTSLNSCTAKPFNIKARGKRHERQRVECRPGVAHPPMISPGSACWRRKPPARGTGRGFARSYPGWRRGSLEARKPYPGLSCSALSGQLPRDQWSSWSPALLSIKKTNLCITTGVCHPRQRF